jgi:phosphoenolpyruvate carboxykinase (ATP)
VQETGTHNLGHAANEAGLSGTGKVFWNLNEPALYERAIARGEARLTTSGALVAETGSHTGRSPNDRYIVRDAETEDAIWWDNANGMTPEQFEALRQDFLAHAASRTLFAQDLHAGADPASACASSPSRRGTASSSAPCCAGPSARNSPTSCRR